MAHVYMETVIQRCVCLPHIKQLQAHFLTTGLFKFSPLRSRLLDLCAVSPAGDLSFASLIFRHILAPSTNDWNAIIRGLAASPHPSRAVAWFRSMLRTSSSSPRCKVDALTCSFTLKACARALCSSETLQLHPQVARRGLITDALLCTSLLDAYAKTGDLSSAHKLFDEMSVRDIASWNSLIAGLASGNRAYDALALYKKMEGEGLKPNEVTVLGALAACSHLGALKEGEKIHKYIKAANLDGNVIVCNAVIHMYAKCGSADKAFSVFDHMAYRKNLVTWNTMIMGFAMHGDGRKAIDIFEQMRFDGVKPDSVSYLAAMCACNHAGLVEYGVKLFNSMASDGVEPNMKHYGCLVDLLGRAGRLKEAYDVISSMPMVPDLVLWQSLLGASQLYKNIEMAEVASRKLVEMGSNNCGDYVLLSNVYAANERWSDVRRVRDAMRVRDVKKVPGFSYIEVKGSIHKFCYGDKSHERWREIHEKLEEVRLKIKELGYVAETKFVLHDIGEEEKENALCLHSEKLAVALGLILTEEGEPIQVMKNLRICGDCHLVFKHVSKIYKREIIVRDRVRFHRFKEGSCSCRDYW